MSSISEAHSATAQRMAVIHFDKVQLFEIHRKQLGSSKWNVVAATVGSAFPLSEKRFDSCSGTGRTEDDIGVGSVGCTLLDGSDLGVDASSSPIHTSWCSLVPRE